MMMSNKFNITKLSGVIINLVLALRAFEDCHQSIYIDKLVEPSIEFS